MADVKRNFVYSIAWNVSTYVTSLIIFPYVSRTLGAEALGINEYVHQFVLYFTLFSMLGVLAIGTREIAMCGDDIEKRTKAFSSILGLSTFLTLLVVVVYVVCIFTINEFQEYKRLFLIGTAQIIFTTFQIEWFFRGIENFRYTTYRNIAIRIVYMVAIFLFIHDESDYELYFILTTLVVVVNALVNLLYSRHYVKFVFDLSLYRETWGRLSKQFALLGANNIMNSFYSSFNVVYLGMVCTKTEVGYYSVSNKIMNIILGIITAFTLVMLPRMSNLANDENKSRFTEMLNKSFGVVIDACIPLCLMLFCYAPTIVKIISGEGFHQAILPLRIIAPIVLINALAQILVFQVEMPLHKDKAILTASIIGAVVGVTLNLAIVKQNGVVGSAIVLSCSVFVSFMYNFLYCYINRLIQFPFKKLIGVLLKSVPYVGLWLLLNICMNDEWLVFCVGCIMSLFYWMILNKSIIQSFSKSIFKTN